MAQPALTVRAHPRKVTSLSPGPVEEYALMVVPFRHFRCLHRIGGRDLRCEANERERESPQRVRSHVQIY